LPFFSLKGKGEKFIFMLIRKLTEADAQAFKNIRLRGLQDHPAAFGSSYEDELKRPLSRTIERIQGGSDPANNFLLGAFEDGLGLVGTVGFSREQGLKSQHRAYITSVYTIPEVRGRGVAKALMNELIGLARRMPDLEQLLLGVGAANTVARNLYLGLGFEIYGLERRALKIGDQYIDEELMVLWLNKVAG